jgi:hypothetical protein
MNNIYQLVLISCAILSLSSWPLIPLTTIPKSEKFRFPKRVWSKGFRIRDCAPVVWIDTYESLRHMVGTLGLAPSQSLYKRQHTTEIRRHPCSGGIQIRDRNLWEIQDNTSSWCIRGMEARLRALSSTRFGRSGGKTCTNQVGCPHNRSGRDHAQINLNVLTGNPKSPYSIIIHISSSKFTGQNFDAKSTHINFLIHKVAF